MLRHFLRGLLVIILLAALVSGSWAENGSEPSPLEVFEQRIMPIFKSPKPSSCVQCHLAAVDLKEYILPSHEKTFASLRDQGLIDLDAPQNSKILQLIRMGEKDLDKGARLIHEKTREAEYHAFASWIEACCHDPRLRNLPPLSDEERATPDKPDEVIRHARKSRLVDSFVRQIWSQRMRCFPCHTPHELDETNPRHQKPIENQQKFEQQYGSELARRIRLFQETPEATMQLFIERSRDTPPGELPLLNLNEPWNSLLVVKPTSKLPQKDADGKLVVPTSSDQRVHMGGLKMHRDDQSYKSFIAWIQDYARVVGNEYTSVEDLPADNWHATNTVLKLTDAPEAWPVGIPVQLFVHAWDEQQESWTPEPIAFTQGTVTPRRIVNGALFKLAPHRPAQIATPPDPANTALPRGKVLVKTYVDFRHRLSDDPTILLDEDDFAGAAEIPKARWREGFVRAEAISGRLLTKE